MARLAIGSMRYVSWIVISISLTGLLACNRTDLNSSSGINVGSASEAVQEPLFSTISDDSGLKAAHSKSTESLSSFLNAFKLQKYSDVEYLVKAKFTRKDTAEQVHMWVALQTIKGEDLICRAIEVPEGFDGLVMGKDILLTTDEIEDWMINDSGVVYGAYTLRLQRDNIPDDQKAAFDEYVGIKTFTDELP
ncbi:MAG: DUF2314 domain-containing protein [Cyanobacteria bacterium P01_A01_bin.17]